MKLALFLGLSAAAFAQLTGPTPGYVFDADTRELRPMRGFAGSAHLGDALLKDVDAAAVSGDGKFAAAARNGAIELIQNFDSASPVSIALGQIGTDTHFAWFGHDLAVVSEATHRGAFFRGGEQIAAIDLGGIAGDIHSIAFDGKNVFLAAEGGLYRANAAETSRLAEMADAIALASDGKRLYAADGVSGAIYQIDGDQVSTFATVAGAVGLQLAQSRLLVASSATHSIEAFDLESKQVVSSLALEFLPARLQSLGASPFALLNAASDSEPLWVIDTRDQLQVFFVPAGREQ